jgi:hypothetical protein
MVSYPSSGRRSTAGQVSLRMLLPGIALALGVVLIRA